MGKLEPEEGNLEGLQQYIRTQVGIDVEHMCEGTCPGCEFEGKRERWEERVRLERLCLEGETGFEMPCDISR